MAGHNALVRKFKQFNGSPPAHTRGRPDDRERSVKLFAEVQKIYRVCSPAAAREICRLALEAEDERVRSVCAGMVMDRAWGRPQEYDPNAEAPKRAPSLRSKPLHNRRAASDAGGYADDGAAAGVDPAGGGRECDQLTGATGCAAGRASRRTVRKPGRSSLR
jgi:hypothetical protein